MTIEQAFESWVLVEANYTKSTMAQVRADIAKQTPGNTLDRFETWVFEQARSWDLDSGEIQIRILIHLGWTRRQAECEVNFWEPVECFPAVDSSIKPHPMT